MDNVTQRIRELVADQLSVPVEIVNPASRLLEDLGADSLDVVELVMNIEEEFEIEIDDEDAEKVVTVADAIALVQRLMA